MVADPGSDTTADISPPGMKGVVGIGASAGGLGALESFFRELPAETGMTYVVVQHLSPDYKSAMDEIISRFTSIPVVHATEGMRLEPNYIYLIPPNHNLTIVDACFHLSDMDRSQIQRPIDLLFQSLARGYGSFATSVVLSGTGSDGAEGTRAVHEAGGRTYAQSPTTAQFDGMPKNAIATGAVHYTLPADEIATAVTQVAAAPVGEEQESLSVTEASDIRLVFSVLSERHGVRFQHYKESTVARRIERRVQSRNCQSLREYVSLLQTDSAEVDALYHDLLIGVTKFFRDAEAFHAFEVHLRQIIRRLAPAEELRLWVAGCATGEEAYTLAMLAIESFERIQQSPRLKILATDAHQEALNKAARGVYSAESVEFVTRQRQVRFFTPMEGNQYRVAPEIRRHIIFARHDMIEDPPFTRIHAITCRNVLIYFRSKPQLSAISSFHFALETDGIMMLGSSETPGRLQEEFATLDPTWRIYRKLRAVNAPIDLNAKPKAMEWGPRRLSNVLTQGSSEQLSFVTLLEAYDLLLGEFVDCGLLLDENRNLLHVFGNANRYLQNNAGRFSGNLMRMLVGEARATVGAALMRSAKEPGAKFTLRNVPMGSANAVEVDVNIRTLRSSVNQSNYWFVEFCSSEPRAIVEHEVQVAGADGEYEVLKAELAFAKESLSSTIEELEMSNEELQSTNEELIASNEELQSTNQELHSVNEELFSVNAENQRRIQELQEVSEDIENLLSSTNIGAIFVDEQMHIRRFTPAATHFFNLVNHDVGRALSSFTHCLRAPDLLDQIGDVLDSGEPFSRDVETTSGTRALVKIVPYISNNQRKGAIVNIFDESLISGRVNPDHPTSAND